MVSSRLIEDRYQHRHWQRSTVFSLFSHLVDSQGEKTISVSRENNYLGTVEWDLLEHTFKEVFTDSQYLITVSSDEIVMP